MSSSTGHGGGSSVRSPVADALGDDQVRDHDLPADPASPPGAERPAISRLEWLMLGLVILGSVAQVLWRLRDSYRYYMDDLLQFAVAHAEGLSWDLLGLNVFQHFGPANRLGHLFIVRIGDLSLGAGMLLSGLLVGVFLASLLWLLHELRTSFRARLLSLIAVGLSITVLDTSVWADASLHIFPALIVTDAVLAAHLRAVTTGRRGWHVGTVLIFAAGVLTQERALFALPLVVLADWFVLGAGQSFRDRVLLLRRLLLPLAALTAVAVLAAAYIYLFYVAGSSAPRPALGTTARTGLGALTEGLAPPWLGIRLDELSSVPVELGLLAVMLVVAVVLIRIRRSNADALGFLAASFLLYYGFLALSPILNADNVTATALRLHNGSYLLVPTVIAVTRLRFTREGPAVTPRPRRAWITVVAAVLLAALLLTTGGRFTGRTWYAERAAHAYLAELQKAEPTWSDPATTLIPLQVPATIAQAWAEVYGRHELFLRWYQRDWVPQVLGDRPIVLDFAGRPRPVALEEQAPLTVSSGAGCGDERTVLRAGELVQQEPLFLRLTYRTTGTAGVTASPTAGGSEPDPSMPANWGLALEPGEHTVVLPLHSDQVRQVLLDWTGATAGGCVVAADLVRPVFVDGDVCTDMDVYGTPTQPTACPAVRP